MANINGTNVAASVVPFTTDDTYPTHDSTYGKGGYHEVNTIEERDSIPKARRRAGMAVYVVSEKKQYNLNVDLSTWTEFGGSSSGGTDDRLYLIWEELEE